MSDDAEAAVGDALGTVSVPVSRKTTSFPGRKPMGKPGKSMGKPMGKGDLIKKHGFFELRKMVIYMKKDGSRHQDD